MPCHGVEPTRARVFIRTTELRIDAWIEVATEKVLPATCVGDLRLRLLERQRFWKAEALKRLRDIEPTLLHLRTANVPEISRATSPLAEQASREQQECIEQTDPATDCGSTSTREGEESSPAPDSMEIPERTRKFLNNLLSSEGVRFDESVERYWQELV